MVSFSKLSLYANKWGFSKFGGVGGTLDENYSMSGPPLCTFHHFHLRLTHGVRMQTENCTFKGWVWAGMAETRDCASFQTKLSDDVDFRTQTLSHTTHGYISGILNTEGVKRWWEIFTSTHAHQNSLFYPIKHHYIYRRNFHRNILTAICLRIVKIFNPLNVAEWNRDRQNFHFGSLQPLDQATTYEWENEIA